MLYKYTKIDEYLSSILKDGYIFAASPEVLNDPFEARLCFSEQNKNDYFDAVSDACIDEKESSFRLAMNNNVRISSFSKDKNNQLLWSLYADSHKGVCIGIEESKNTLSLSEDVEYELEYPVFHYDPYELYQDDFRKRVLLTKSKAWKYEEERRLVIWHDESYLALLNEKLDADDCLNTKFERVGNSGTKIFFGAKNIYSVILGAKISKKDRCDVLSMLEGSDVNVFQAKISRGKYVLEYKKLE
ncbi:MAG: DUF2971 domain-containing protein [Iodobacter sp.]